MTRAIDFKKIADDLNNRVINFIYERLIENIGERAKEGYYTYSYTTNVKRHARELQIRLEQLGFEVEKRNSASNYLDDDKYVLLTSYTLKINWNIEKGWLTIAKTKAVPNLQI